MIGCSLQVVFLRKIKNMIIQKIFALLNKNMQANDGAELYSFSEPKIQSNINPFISEKISGKHKSYSDKLKVKNLIIYPLSPKLEKLRYEGLAKEVHHFFKSTNLFKNLEYSEILRSVVTFNKVFLESPIIKNDGGANYNTGLIIYCMCRLLEPTLIVECGVFKGMSSYLMREACPKAEIHAFDPVFDNLKHRSRNVNYHNFDWESFRFNMKKPFKGFCYFDDHQNQAVRLIQAYNRGFRVILVDDSWPIEVPGCGWPPLPSIDMILNDNLKVGEKVQWLESGKIWTYTFDKKEKIMCDTARSLIKNAYDVPSLYRSSGISPTSALKLVELLSPK